MSGRLRLKISHEQSPLMFHGQWICRDANGYACTDMITGQHHEHVWSITLKWVEMRSLLILHPKSLCDHICILLYSQTCIATRSEGSPAEWEVTGLNVVGP